jgi:hypothetical protein
MKSVRVAAGGAMWGDAIEPAIDLAKHGDIQYLGFDFLAELTMSMLHRQKQRDPAKGFVPDVVPWLRELLPITRERGIKIITNAGGANCAAAGAAALTVARATNLGGMRIGIVEDTDLLPLLDSIEQEGWTFENLDTGERGLDRVRDRMVAADVYTGADGIIEALAQDADVVITGRASDNALYVGPIMHDLGWNFDGSHSDRIAAAITAGHIIECGCACTGGMSGQYQLVPEPWNIGYPIAEVTETGDITISKLKGTGGLVNQWTVKEHLVYEVLDPGKYLMPDGVADFTALQVTEVAQDEVLIRGARGEDRPDTMKMIIGYEDGWIGEGLVLFPWPDALQRAQHAERILRGRFDRIGVEIDELEISYVGINTLGGTTAPEPLCDLNEVGIRVAVRTRTEFAADAVRRECTHLWTMGPVGTAFGVPFRPRRVISVWPTLVPRDFVKISTRVEDVI